MVAAHVAGDILARGRRGVRGKDTGAIMQVWDADTGEVLRGMPTVIESHYEWSADGAHVAEIWPGGDRESVLDGKVIVKKRKGGVSVRSALTGEKLSLRRLEDNKGMHPPWGRIEEPLIYLFPRNKDLGEARVFDRDTGRMISRFKVRELTGLHMAGSPEIAVLKGGKLIAASVVEQLPPIVYHWPNSVVEQEQGYVVLIDVMERREITRTRVGARCTNAVVAYE